MLLALLFLAWDLAIVLVAALDKLIFWGIVMSTLLTLRLAMGKETEVVPMRSVRSLLLASSLPDHFHFQHVHQKWFYPT